MKPKRETARHSAAWEFYYSLGSSRSLPQVARKYAVSLVAAKGWSAAFSWDRRIADRDREIASKTAERNVRDVVEMQDRHLKMMRAIQAAYIKKIQRDAADPSASDLIRASEYEAKLLGYEPETSGATAKDVQESIQLVIYLLSTKIPDSCPHCHGVIGFKSELSQELSRLEQKYSTNAPVVPPPATPDAGVQH